MKFIIAIVISLLAAAISYISLDKSSAERIKWFAVADEEAEYTSKNIPQTRIIMVAAILAIMAFLTTLQIMAKVNTPNGIMKMTLALLCMIGAGVFDYREYRIPNVFPLVMAVGAVILLVAGLLSGMDGAVAYITTSVVAAIACALILIAASALTKQGIGAGDIKLISALALLTGVYSVIGTLFFGVVACTIYAVVALIMKKKTTSSSVPFGPFLLLGYIITLFTISF